MDTIVAISTAMTNGGIGIIRMSGKDTFSVLNKIFEPKQKEEIDNIKGYTIKYGNIIDKRKNNIIDEVLVSYFRTPKSYTREDMCEINSHGGQVVMKQILNLCLQNGAVLAQPGEFTKRAFLNGRIDLSQAESVIDIINAKTDKEAKASMKQLDGALSRDIQKIRHELLDIMVDIEASIDYPEYDVEEVTNTTAIKILQQIKTELNQLQNTFYNGKLLREGLKVAIVGRPNAGKSSLLNAILNENRAIVTEYEGTTRDTIEEFIVIEGIPLKIIDTAGIREARDEVEKIGIQKAKDMIQEADFVIAMFDVSEELVEEDEEILKIIQDRDALVVLNKVDKKQVLNREKIKKAGKSIVEISALNKTGIENIFKVIINQFELNKIEVDDSYIITNQRHQEAIQHAIEHVESSISAICENMPIDIIAINIKEILEVLGKITGESVTDDIIQEIFKKFCLGK